MFPPGCCTVARSFIILVNLWISCLVLLYLVAISVDNSCDDFHIQKKSYSFGILVFVLFTLSCYRSVNILFNRRSSRKTESEKSSEIQNQVPAKHQGMCDR